MTQANEALEKTLGKFLTRKACLFTEANEIPSLETAKVEGQILSLHRFETGDLRIGSPLDGFFGDSHSKAEYPAWFVLEDSDDGTMYIVNTEGYNYCRYIGRLSEEFVENAVDL